LTERGVVGPVCPSAAVNRGTHPDQWAAAASKHEARVAPDAVSRRRAPPNSLAPGTRGRGEDDGSLGIGLPPQATLVSNDGGAG